jgi:hypothetical protein
VPRKPAEPKKPPVMCRGCGFARAACQCLELHLLRDIRAVGLPEPVREFAFAKDEGRKFRADFAWPDRMLLVECEGGLFRGRHTSAAGYSSDMAKYNLASRKGYVVLRFGAKEIRGGQAVRELEVFFGKG